MDNRELYNRERNRRWSMAKEKEPEAIDTICRILRQGSGHEVEKIRYDEIWFGQFAPNMQQNAWVRALRTMRSVSIKRDMYMRRSS